MDKVAEERKKKAHLNAKQKEENLAQVKARQALRKQQNPPSQSASQPTRQPVSQPTSQQSSNTDYPIDPMDQQPSTSSTSNQADGPPNPDERVNEPETITLDDE